MTDTIFRFLYKQPHCQEKLIYSIAADTDVYFQVPSFLSKMVDLQETTLFFSEIERLELCKKTDAFITKVFSNTEGAFCETSLNNYTMSLLSTKLAHYFPNEAFTRHLCTHSADFVTNRMLTMHLWFVQKYLQTAIIHLSDEATKKMAKDAQTQLFVALEEELHQLEMKGKDLDNPKLVARYCA